MKKLVIIPLLFLCGIAFSQIYTPVAPVIYGHNELRIKPFLVLHVPEKSELATLTNDTTAQIFYNKTDSSIWAWSTARGYWRVGSNQDVDVNLYHAYSTLNYNGTRIINYNVNGAPLDSVDLPHTDLYAKLPLRITDTLSGTPQPKLLSLSGSFEGGGDTTCGDSYITEDSIYWVRLYCDGSIRDSTYIGYTIGNLVDTGTFVSTATAVTNVSSTTPTPTMRWTRTGDNISIYLSGSILPTSTGATEISFSIPIATSLPNGSLVGTSSIAENAGTAVAPAYAYTSSSSVVILRFIATVASSGSYFLILNYPL